MAIQFPADPAAQTPINTFSPNSTPVANTENTLVYVWNGSAWIGSGDPVDVTPNLQAVTDQGNTTTNQITLPGGGGDADALQKQEVEALIAAVDAGVSKLVAGDGINLDPAAGTGEVTITSAGGGGTVINYNGASAWGYVTSAGVIKGSHNVDDVDKTGAGEYSVVFKTPMATADYSITTGGNVNMSSGGRTVNGFTVSTFDDNNSPANKAFSFAVHSLNAIAPQSGVGADAWALLASSGERQGSYNINEPVKNSNGHFTISFTSPMPSSNYAVTATATSTGSRSVAVSNQSETGFDLKIFTEDGTTTNNGVHFAVHASSTVTPSYTWTRDGTTLLPANSGDTVNVGKFTGSTTGLAGYSFQYDVNGLARFAFGEQGVGANAVGFMRYQHLVGAGSTNYTDIFQSNNDLKISTAGSVGIGSGSASNIKLSSDGTIHANRWERDGFFGMSITKQAVNGVARRCLIPDGDGDMALGCDANRWNTVLTLTARTSNLIVELDPDDSSNVLDVKALLLEFQSKIETLEAAKASLEARLSTLEGGN